MTRILIVERDEALRRILRGILTDAADSAAADHYDVTEVTTETDALAYLTAPAHTLADEGVVVVVSNQYADHHWTAAFFEEVAAHPDLAARHHYFLLSSNPSTIPQELHWHLAELGATTLPKPFSLEDFLTAVRNAAARVAAYRSGEDQSA